MSTASYYYDKISTNTCGEGRDPVVSGYTKCESYTRGPNQLPLAQRNTNNIIAIGELFGGSEADRATWCGKQVVVTYKGRQITAPDGGDFYVWDGCEACSSPMDVRMDFSASAAQEMDPAVCTNGLVPGVNWVITSKQAVPFLP